MKNKHEATLRLIYSAHPPVHMHGLDFMGSSMQTTAECGAVIYIVMSYSDSPKRNPDRDSVSYHITGTVPTFSAGIGPYHTRARTLTHTHARTTFCSSTLPPSGRQRSWPMHWAEASGSTCWQSVLHVGTALQRQVSRWVQKEVRASDHSGVWQRSRPLMSGHQIDNLFIKPYKRKSKSDVALKQINIACSYWLCQILFSLYDNL